MKKRGSFGQPLMMRKDYGKKEDTDEKEALMFKSVPIKDYDEVRIKKLCERDWEIDDYDDYKY